MIKHKTLIINWVLPVFAALCGLVAFCMIFIDAIGTVNKITGLAGSSYSGLVVSLGLTESIGNITRTVFSFNILALLSYLLPLVGAVAIIIGKDCKIANVVAAATLIVGGVLMLLMSVISKIGASNSLTVLYDFTMKAAPIAGGILAIVAGVAAGAKLFMQKDVTPTNNDVAGV